MKLRIIPYLLSLVLITLSSACKKDSPGSELPAFDRTALLEKYALQIIRPAFEDLLDKTNELSNQWQAFQATPGETQLQTLRDQWLTTAVTWQSANAFNFGPAGEEGLRKGLIEEIGTFPVNTEKIENFIAAGDATLNNFDRDSRGLLAIEYLLYGDGQDLQDVLTALENEQRQTYLSALIDHLHGEVERVTTAWETYQNEFISNNGTDVGSSISQLYNEFVRSYEAAKNFKVGLPAGKRAGQTQPEPQLVEAYYSGKSRELLTAHLAMIDRLYYGKAQGGPGSKGFYEYLQSVEGGPTLIASTEAQWAAVENALGKVPTSPAFSQLVAQEDPTVNDLHTEMQKQIRFFKSDMSSLLGIAITFSSGDGD